MTHTSRSLASAKRAATRRAWDNMTVHAGVRVDHDGQTWVRRAQQGIGTVRLGKWEQVA